MFVTVFSTIISGVLVFVFSQLFIEYCLKPIQDFKKLKSKVVYYLNYYARVYNNATVKPSIDERIIKEAEEKLTELACEVEAFAEIRPKISFLIPSVKDLQACGKRIRGISNRCRVPDETTSGYIQLNYYESYEVKRLLGISEGNIFYKKHSNESKTVLNSLR